MATFIKIATVEVGAGGASSMDFSSIPSTYTDLVLKVSSRDTNATGNNGFVTVQFNGSTSGYSNRWIRGAGSGTPISSMGLTTGIDGGIGQAMDSAGNTASTFANVEFYIPNYAGSTNKSVSNDSVSEENGTTAYMGLNAGLWSNTAAITSISIKPTTLFAQYSTATLYGISKS